jgi:acyl-coenzyme A synthetase/AMP-(fatty) acid ligase
VHRSDPGLFLGYLDAPGDTSARFRGEWFLTGDTVQTDADGAVRYLGREDDMMNAGGYRVSPVEVEEAMLRAPGITECAAAEVAVRADATVIACFYASAEPLDDAALARHASETLARYKQPRLFVRMPALPRGAHNKLRRRDLRRDWETAHGQA